MRTATRTATEPNHPAKLKKTPRSHRGVYEHPAGSGIWWINWYTNGQRHREKVGRRGDAIALYQKRKTDARMGVKMPASMRASRAVIFSEIAAEAMIHSRANKRSSRGDTSNLASLLPVFGKMKADEITTAQIESYLESRTDLKPATKNRYRSTLSMIFKIALRRGKISSNPARAVPPLRENNSRKRYLTLSEEDVIREIILRRTPTHEPAFTFALETGLRLSEQHTLTWCQVNLSQRTIELRQTKNDTPRIVLLSDLALDCLRRCEAFGNGRSEAVFLSRFGEPLRNPRAWFSLVMKDAVKIDGKLKDVTWHTFRHTFISRLVMAGTDLRTVQELAGHKDISMTARYAHLSPNHKLDAVKRLAAYRAQHHE